MKENTEVAKIALNAPTGDFDVREVKIASFGEKVSVIAPDEIDENVDGVNVIGSIKASRKKVSEEENAIACFLNENGEALYADVFEDANGKTIGYLQTNRKNEYIRIVKFRIIPIILIIFACAAVLTGVFFALRGASVPADNPAATASVEPGKTQKPEKTEEPQKTDNHEKTQEPANTDSPQPAKTPGATEAEGKDNTKDETFSIVYNLNGGELSEENPTSYNKKTPGFTLKNPVKNGYEFLGWRDENTGTVSDNVSISAEDKGNKSYTALWRAIEYSIAYELNEGTQIKENPTSYTIESEDFTLNAPVREGYTFKGFTGSNGDEPQADVKIEKGTTGVLSYTANWEAIEYTITIDADGGEFAEENPTSYTIESEDFTLNAPVREGYTFKGFTGSNGDEPQADVKIEKGTTGVLSYTANWEAIEYTITIDADGGEFAEENPTSYTIESEDFTLNAPVREGYTFKGFTGSNGDEPQADVKIEKGTTGVLSYTANWELVTYSITYELNGGELTAENPAQYNFNTPDFTLNNPKKDGYVFAGWTGSNGIAPQGSVTVLQGSYGDLRYVANWEIINYSISYELDGGIGSNENPSEYNVETDTFTLKPPVKEGYTFKGFTGSNGDVPQVIVTIEKGSLGDRTYTANWEVKSYSVTYELDGGSLPEGVRNPSSYTMFTEDFTLNAPTKTGYTFIGWTGSNGETPELNVTVSKGSSGNRTYTANWGEETYTVTYDLNGGALAEGEENPTEYSLNSDDFTLINPTTKRLEFMGWTGSNGDVPELNVTVPKGTSGNLTYKANWVCATFTDGTKLTYDQLRLPENGTKYGYKAEYLKENSISETSSVRTGIFYGCSTIKTLDFPDSVKTLNAYRSETFARASSLERVSFSDDINVKNNYISFESCSKLNDVKLPENCSGYFWYCTSIESVGPKGSGADCELKVETLGENMFYGCTSLKKLEIPEGTKTIMFRCFRYCPIEEIIYPEGMENVDGGAFDASYVKHVYIPKSMTKMANMGFYGASYGDYGPNVAYEEFIYHDFNMRTAGPAGNGYDVEYEWDTEIPDSIFVNTYMNILHIPNTITKIGTYNLPKGCFCVDYDGTLAEWNAIDKAKNWDNNKINYGHIYNYYVVCNDGVIDRNGVTDYIIDNGVIYNPDKTELVYVKPDVQIEKLVIPETVKSIRKNAFKFNFGVTELVMPDSIAELEDYTIAQAYALKKITLSSNTTKIKKGVLFNCVELEEITLPDKVTSVGYKAFSECNALKRVILNDGLKSIDSGALRKNNSLEYVRIPASVETIGGGVFDYSPLLKTAGPIGGEYNIEFGWTDKIPNNAFNSSVVNANVLESITIPETITEIGARAFQNTTKLGEVNFPDAISKIGLSAFYCSGISGRVELPSSLTEMGNEAFSGCSRMTSVVIPSGITEINADVFSGDSELTEVNFEDSNNLTRICESAFSGDSKLTAINLPESLSVIESRAFSGDSSLDGLYIPAGVNLIYEDAFSEVPNLHYHGRAEYGPWGQASDYTENSTVTANVAPTCTTDGYTDVTYDCGYAEHTVLPAQHNYVDYVCSVCGKSIENSVRKIKSGVIYDFVEEKNTLWASIWKSNNDVPGDERMHSTSTWMVDSDGSLIMDWTVFGNGGEDSSLDITIDGELVLAGVSGDKNGSFRISKGSHTVTASYKNSADEDDGSLNGARIIFELNPDDYVNKSEKVLDSGDVNYQFTEVNGQPGTWRSNNAEQTSTSAVTTWELVSDGTLEVEWNVSGSKYDSFSLTLDTYTKKVNGVTGDRSGKFTLSAGKHTLVAAYKRNTTTTDGFTNAATVKFNSPDGSSNSVTKREELDNYGFRQYNDGWLCDFQQYNKTAVSTWRVASNGYCTIEWKVIDTNGSDPLKIYVDDKLEVDYEGWAGGSGYILLPRGEHVVRAEYEFNSMNSGGGDRAFIKFVDNDATTMGNKVEYNDEGSANEGYKFVADGNVWTSDNQYIYNSVALSEWSVNSDGNMSIAWTVSSSEWDTLTVELDGTKVVDAESGDNNGSFTVPSGTHILKAMYSKTDYGEDLEDTATITFNYSEGSTNSYTNTSNGLTLGFEEVDGVWTSNNGAYANSSATAKWNVRSNGGLHIKYSSLGEEYDSFIIYIDGDEHFCNANETGLIDIPSGDHTITAEYIISEKGDKWAKIEFVSDADYPTVGNITNYCDNTSNASDYFFAEENGIWRSNNAGQASTQAESEWTVGSDGTMNIYWNISAGSADKLILYVDGEKSVSESGEASDAISLSYGIHKVKAVYEKGSSGSSGSDCAELRFSNEAPQTPDGEVVTNTGNGSNYYFEQGSNGTWASNNDGKEASSATSSWKINSNGTAKINWSLNNDDTSFGANDYYGCFTLYVDGQIEVYRATGTESGVIELPEGVHSVRAIYEKRSNYYNPGDDKAYIRFTYTRNTTPGETTENSITNTDNGDYKFVEEPEKTWTSNNKNVNSSEAMSEWKVVSDGTVKLNWSVSSESSYDKLSIYVDNDEVVSAASGTNSGEITFEEGEHTVKAVYSKDGSSSSGDDCAKLSFSVALPQEPVDNSVTNNSNGNDYYFVGQEKVWTSNNKGVSSSQAVSEWEVGSDGTLKINWTVSSETNYDKLTIYVDGTEAVSAKSGIDSGTITIPAGKHTVKAVYLKDSSQDGNDDQAVLTFVY